MRSFKDFFEWLRDDSESTFEYILRLFPVIIVFAVILVIILYFLS